MTQSGDGVVVEIHVRDLDIGREGMGLNCEAVIVRRDLDLSSRQVLDRLISTAVSEL